jgi:hypothetical protein
MTKIIIDLLVTLDGFFQDTPGELYWALVWH